MSAHTVPFFSFLHSFDAHFPSTPNAPSDTRYDPDYKGTLDGRDRSLDPYRRGEATPSPRDVEHILALNDGALSELDAPPRPLPPYDLTALDVLLRRPDLLPPAVEVKRIAAGEYELMMPGMKEPLRITTSRERFEEHPGTYELWSPGSPLFPAADAVPPPVDQAPPGTALRELIASPG